MSNQTEECVPTLQRGDRIRMTEESLAFHGMRGTVTSTDVTPGYIGVWLDGDCMERWPRLEDVAFVERPMRPMIYAPEDVAKELRKAEAAIQAGERP